MARGARSLRVAKRLQVERLYPAPVDAMFAPLVIILHRYFQADLAVLSPQACAPSPRIWHGARPR
jgi:hypothetical protein